MVLSREEQEKFKEEKKSNEPENYGVGGKGVRVSRDIFDWISDTFEHKYLKSKKQESQLE